MKRLIAIALTSLALGATGFSIAADAPAPAKAAAEVAQAKGVVKKVDAAAGVVNLAHDPIPALKWPAMTMDFKVKDAKLLSGLKPGQQVSFGLVKEGGSGYVISRIEAAK